MRIYCDIDGTLTVKQKKWAEPILERIQKIKDLVADGHEVIIWSGSSRYAKRWCRKYGIKGVTALGKPQYICDNNKRVRPGRLMANRDPEWLDLNIRDMDNL